MGQRRLVYSDKTLSHGTGAAQSHLPKSSIEKQGELSITWNATGVTRCLVGYKDCSSLDVALYWKRKGFKEEIRRKGKQRKKKKEKKTWEVGRGRSENCWESTCLAKKSKFECHGVNQP